MRCENILCTLPNNICICLLTHSGLELDILWEQVGHVEIQTQDNHYQSMVNILLSCRCHTTSIRPMNRPHFTQHTSTAAVQYFLCVNAGSLKWLFALLASSNISHDVTFQLSVQCSWGHCCGFSIWTSCGTRLIPPTCSNTFLSSALIPSSPPIVTLDSVLPGVWCLVKTYTVQSGRCNWKEKKYQDNRGKMAGLWREWHDMYIWEVFIQCGLFRNLREVFPDTMMLLGKSVIHLQWDEPANEWLCEDWLTLSSAAYEE